MVIDVSEMAAVYCRYVSIGLPFTLVYEVIGRAVQAQVHLILLRCFSLLLSPPFLSLPLPPPHISPSHQVIITDFPLGVWRRAPTHREW